MDPIIINHPGLNLAGYSIATRMENGDNLRQIPEFWGEYADTLRQPLLAALGRADAAEYGLIHDFDPDTGRFSYMIGMEYPQPLPLPPGCAQRRTPPAKYAVFTTKPAGSDAEFGQAIQGAWRYITQDWLPASKQWEQAPLGAFERYDGRCAPDQPQRQMDIYIPVQPRRR